MNLGAKLLAAPLLTAVMVLSIATVNTLLQSRVSMQNQTSFKSDMESFRTITSAQDQFAQLHASVYKTVALIGSMDEPKVKAFRSALANQVAGLKRTLASLAEAGVDNAGFNAGVLPWANSSTSTASKPTRRSTCRPSTPTPAVP